MAAKFEFHPASEIFPLLEGKEFDELVESIKTNGQQVPILLHQGKILDGRNRYLACLKAKAEPWTSKAELDGKTPAEYVLILNLNRRHLTFEQRAFAAAEAKKFFEADALARMKAGKAVDPSLNLGEGSPGKSSDKAAEAFDVSPATVDFATKVKEHGSAALIKAVEDGDVSMSAAAVVADLPKLEQTLAVKAGPAAVKALAKETKAAKAAEAKPTKPKAGKPTVDLRKFAELEKEIGKCARLSTAIKDHCGGANYHEEIRQHLNDSMKVLAKWRKGSGAA